MRSSIRHLTCPTCEPPTSKFLLTFCTSNVQFCVTDFGWGKPGKVETVLIDYNGSISMNASKKSNEALEIGVCLSTIEMETFVRNFDIRL